MTERDKPRFLQALTALAEMFEKQPSDALVGLYWECTKGVAIEEFERAVFSCAQGERFMPKPADILERAGHGKHSLEDRALVAWTDAWDAVGSQGPYQSVVFADEVTSEVVRQMGGWVAFCNPEQAVEWHRKEFTDLYRAFARSGRQCDASHHPGLIECNNAGQFQEYVPKPVLVGRHDRPALSAREEPPQSVAAILGKLEREKEP